MRFNQAFTTLQNLIKAEINQAELGRVLGVSRANINYKKQANVLLSDEDVKKIETYYNISLTDETQNKIIAEKNDIVKIPYWSGLPDELKISDFTCVTAERNVIKNHWGLNPESLCIVPMVGDSLTNYWYPIRNGDILIVDTKVENIMGNGVYFGTSRNNSRLWIREMRIDINLNVEFRSYSPSGEEKKVYTLKELEEVDFKLIGKVIKNVSFRL